MLQKQKLISLIRHFVITIATPATFRGGLLFVSLGLVGVSINVHHVAANKVPAPNHVTIATTVPKSSTPAPVTPTPKTAPTPTLTQPPAPVVTPAPVPVVATPKPVVTSPSSNVSGLKPTAGSTSNSTSSNTGSSSSNSSSGSGSTPRSNSYSSTNWSGYMATSGIFTSITASWVMPNVSGNGRTVTADGTWIGIGGVTTGDLIQTGTQDVVDANGTVSRAAFYEMLPSASIVITDMTISPGDNITASIKEISLDSWMIAITDNTDSDSFSTTVAYNSANSSAEWIEEDPSYANGSQVDFDSFGSVTFTGAKTTVDGTLNPISSLNVASITLVNAAGQALAVPSAVSSATNGFSVTHQ